MSVPPYHKYERSLFGQAAIACVGDTTRTHTQFTEVIGASAPGYIPQFFYAPAQELLVKAYIVSTRIKTII